MNDVWVLALVAGAISAVLLIVMTRLPAPKFLSASVNARSNHQSPTPQTGGFAVVPAIVAAIIWAGLAGLVDWRSVVALTLSTLLLFIAGAIDDARNLSPAPKLAIQFAAAMIAIYGITDSAQLATTTPPLPIILATSVVTLAWAINLTNFMDGLDLMVVAGVGVPALAIGAAGIVGLLDVSVPVTIALVLGAALGPFAWFNRPVAGVFLGDNGSLPIGLFAGIVVIGLSAQFSIFVGLLPFSYFLIDTAVTLAERLVKRENIFTAHSGHAYQVARRAGRPVILICARVALVSLFSAVLVVMAVGELLPPLIALLIGYTASGALYLVMRAGR